jgi:cyclin-dependent kinase
VLVVFKEITHDEVTGIKQEALREVILLKGLNHPNIIRLLDVLYGLSKVTLVLEYMPYDLSKVISQLPPGKGIRPDIVKSFMRQILSAVDYFHQRRIYNRDLCPRNIMVDKDDVLKIIDFGLASCFDLPAEPRTKRVQTVWQRAPEIFFGQKDYSAPVDMWSIGCIFAEMVQGKPLF